MSAALLQHRAHDAFFFLREGDQQMQREHHLSPVLFSHTLRLLQRLLGFLCESVYSEHVFIPGVRSTLGAARDSTLILLVHEATSQETAATTARLLARYLLALLVR